MAIDRVKGMGNGIIVMMITILVVVESIGGIIEAEEVVTGISLTLRSLKTPYLSAAERQ
jgi:hypothetical protein